MLCVCQHSKWTRLSICDCARVWLDVWLSRRAWFAWVVPLAFLVWMSYYVQEAYIRGVSGWNFDVAALKRNANEEGPGLERLSTIAETPGLPSDTTPSLFYAVLCHAYAVI